MKIRLVETCGACPEQYDAYLGSVRVGYLRLRHGNFTVNCPDPGGDEVYYAKPKGDGIFEYEERDYYLRHAVQAILTWVKQRAEAPPAPDVEYEIVGSID